MKMILFASALALGTVAYAQDSSMQPTTPPAAPASDPSVAAPASPAPAAPADGSAPMAAPAPAAAPAGNDASATAAASSTDDSNLPMCSKTVTDKCKQGGGHGKMHHKKM